MQQMRKLREIKILSSGDESVFKRKFNQKSDPKNYGSQNPSSYMTTMSINDDNELMTDSLDTKARVNSKNMKSSKGSKKYVNYGVSFLSNNQQYMFRDDDDQNYTENISLYPPSLIQNFICGQILDTAGISYPTEQS